MMHPSAPPTPFPHTHTRTTTSTLHPPPRDPASHLPLPPSTPLPPPQRDVRIRKLKERDERAFKTLSGAILDDSLANQTTGGFWGPAPPKSGGVATAALASRSGSGVGPTRGARAMPGPASMAQRAEAARSVMARAATSAAALTAAAQASSRSGGASIVPYNGGAPQRLGGGFQYASASARMISLGASSAERTGHPGDMGFDPLGLFSVQYSGSAAVPRWLAYSEVGAPA